MIPDVREPPVDAAQELRNSEGDRPRSAAWIGTLALFFTVSLIEGLVMSHIGAFAPLYLLQMGVAPADVPAWTGVLSAGAFVVGLPLVPFWGVWAERYGRKLVIARSAYVEAVVLLCVGLSRTPFEMAASRFLTGFQLGNTGVMYAALSTRVPRERVGFALAMVGAGSTLGFGGGPAAGGIVADVLGLRTLYMLDAGLSVLSGLAVTLLFHEERRRSPAASSTWRAAWDAISGTWRLPITRTIFLAYILSLTARQMVSPFLPLVVQDLYAGENLATVIGLVVGGTALAGAIVSPAAGALGDRVGYGRVLAWSAAAGVLGAIGLAAARSLEVLALAALVFAAALSAVAAMSVALLATTTPEERRSPTLNLALLPLYIGGMIGPALGAALATWGVRAALLGSIAPLVADTAFARRLRADRLSPARALHEPTVGAGPVASAPAGNGAGSNATADPPPR